MDKRTAYPTWTAAEALAWIDDNHSALGGKERLGLRGDNFAPASRFKNSRVWIDNNATDKRLPGLCVVEVATWLVNKAEDSLPDVSAYGSRVFLIRGTYVDHGADDFAGEVVLAKHSIVAEIKD